MLIQILPKKTPPFFMIRISFCRICTFYFLQGLSINDVTYFLKFVTPPFPLSPHFTKLAYGLTAPFGRSPSPQGSGSE